MPTISFRISDDEALTVAHRMKLSGETNRSEHIKRVYFKGDTGTDELIGTMRKQIDMLTEAVDRSHNLLRQLAANKSDDLDLKLLAGLYMLLYPSVDAGVQATVDRYLDMDTIESFLSNNKKRRG